MKKFSYLFLFLPLLFLSACSNVPANTNIDGADLNDAGERQEMIPSEFLVPEDGSVEAVVDEDVPGTGAVGLANPASVNCLNSGGRLEIKSREIGEYGVCFFEDNRQCEEWALFNALCPIGGVKVTGYDSEAEIFCAITGGKVSGVGSDNPLCERADGVVCPVQENFDGLCQ